MRMSMFLFTHIDPHLSSSKGQESLERERGRKGEGKRGGGEKNEERKKQTESGHRTRRPPPPLSLSHPPSFLLLASSHSHNQGLV